MAREERCYLADREICSASDLLVLSESRLNSLADLLSHFFLASIQPTLSEEKKKQEPSTRSKPGGQRLDCWVAGLLLLGTSSSGVV